MTASELGTTEHCLLDELPGEDIMSELQASRHYIQHCPRR